MVAKISRVVPVAEENLKRPSVKPAADDDYRSAAGIRRRASVYSIGRITVDDPGTMEGQLARYFKASHALAASGESRGDSGSSLIFRDTVLEFAFVSKTLKDFQNSVSPSFMFHEARKRTKLPSKVLSSFVSENTQASFAGPSLFCFVDIGDDVLRSHGLHR